MKKNYRKKYNSNYKRVSTGLSQVRKITTPKPSKAMDDCGPFGKFVGFIIDIIAFKFLHLLVFEFVGCFYKKGKTSPYIGAVAYTVSYILIGMALFTLILLIK